MRRGLLLAGLASALAAAPAATAAPPRVIPWLDQRPSKADAHPPLAAPCRARDLQVRLFLQGATGSLVGDADLTNRGRACSLLGWPRVSFAGGAARATRWRVRRLARSPEPLDVLADPRGSLRALGRGKTATASLFWSNWCGPGARPTGDHGRIPAAILLRLPGGTTLALALTQAPRCDAPQAPSILAVAPFTPAVRTMPPSSRLPLRAAIAGPRPVTVKAGLRGFRVPRGALLRYQLALTNPSRRSFRFGASCPVYVEQLVPSVPARAYILNCRPAGAIAAGATALFEVLLPVPAGARLGSNGLSIELAPRTYEPPFATAAVYIIR